MQLLVILIDRDDLIDLYNEITNNKDDFER